MSVPASAQVFGGHGSKSTYYDPDIDDIVVVMLRGEPSTGQNLKGKGELITPPDIAISAPKLLSQVPGVNIQQGSGSESLTAIRSPVLTGGAGAGSFYYGVNGVSVRAAGFGNVNGFLDLPFGGASHLTVLKGPQSIALGSSALHGGVEASFSGRTDWRGSQAKLALGSDDYAAASVHLPSETLILNASVVHDGGFRDQSGYDKQSLLLEHAAHEKGWNARSFLALTNLNQETAGFARGQDAYKDPELALGNDFPEAFRDVTSVMGAVRLSRELSNRNSRTYLTLTPYFRYNEMDFLLHFLPGQALEQNAHKSLGLKASYNLNMINFDFSLGGSAEVSSGSLYQFQDSETVFSYVQGLHYDFDVTARQLSSFVDVEVQLTARLDIGVGARLETMRYEYDNRADSGTFGRFLRLDDRTDDFTYFMPQASLTYEITPDISASLSARRGARPPQVSDLYRVQINQAEGRADVETLDSVELGLTGEANDLTWEISAYHMKKENFFFRDADGFNVVDGRTQHQGIEGSLDMTLSQHLGLKSSLSLERHSYDFDRNVGNESEIIIAGNRVDSAPDVQGYAELSYMRGDWGLGLSWTHMGDYFTNAANTQDYSGHDIFGLTAAYEFSDDISASLRVDNLTAASYAYRADYAFGSERYFPGRPRSVYLSVSRGF